MTTGLDRRARKTSRRQGRRGHRLLDGARALADRIRSSFALDRLARLGLIARTVLYLLLSYLTVRVATGSGTGGKQANANGALSEVARTPIGEALVVAAAVGFAAFAVARFVSAAADRDTGGWRRLSSAGSGLLYVMLALATASWALGNHSTGSEQAHEESTARFMSLPGGQVIVAGIGVIVVAVCAWQVRVAVTRDYDDGWCVAEMPSWLRTAMPAVAISGMAARAAVFMPVGILLVAAAVTFDPNDAKGLDALLLSLRGSALGLAALAIVAAGFGLFSVYSLVETRFRDIESGA